MLNLKKESKWSNHNLMSLIFARHAGSHDRYNQWSKNPGAPIQSESGKSPTLVEGERQAPGQRPPRDRGKERTPRNTTTRERGASTEPS